MKLFRALLWGIIVGVLIACVITLVAGCKDNKCAQYNRGADHNICVQRDNR